VSEPLKSDNLAQADPVVEALRVVCGWCGKVLHEGRPGAPTSHGFCNSEQCRKAFKGAQAEGLIGVGDRGEPEILA